MKLTPWAYTKLKTFETCMLKGTAQYIDKAVPYAPTPEMEEGNRVHAVMEKAINDGILPSGDDRYLRDFLPSRDEDTKVLLGEVSLGITRDFNTCDFWDKSCWFRGKLDVVDIAGDTCILIDWKTGKPYEDPDELHLHAMLAKARYPEVKHWRGMFIWLASKRCGEGHVLSPAVTYRKLIERTDKILHNFTKGDERKPRQNKLCGWCSVKDCKYNPNHG
jgi:hypothetical protein